MKRSREKSVDAAETNWVGAKVIDDKPSATSKIIVFVLCAAVISATLAFGMVDSWALACFCLLAGATALLWLADAWQTKELRFSPSLLPLFVLGFALVGAIQLLPIGNAGLPPDLLAQPISNSLTLDNFATRLMIAQLAAMLVFLCAALTFINNQKRLQTVTAIVIVFGFALAIFGVIQYFAGEGKIYWLREPQRALPFGPFINRHHFAACMTMIVGLTLGLIYTGAIEKQQRALHFFAVGVMGVGLLMTNSRGALLSLLGVLGFLTLAALIKNKNRIAESGETESDEPTARNKFLSSRIAILGSGLALIVALFAAVLLLGGDTGLLRITGVSTLEQADATNGRLQFWQTTLQIIKDNWLFGVGLDAFGIAYTRYDPANGQFRLERAHNDYLQILAESGIVGGLLAASFIFILFRTGWRIFRQTRDDFRRGVCLGALAGCLGVLIHSLFDFPLRTPSNLLLFFLLTALATVNISHPKLYRRRKSKNDREA